MYTLLGVLLLGTLGTAASQACPPQYNECSTCCDVDDDCGCDHYCPDHPEVWARGCSMPKAGEQTDFLCPAGYTECPNCCDIQTDCNCDEECGPQYPDGFQCSIAPGEDEYTQIGDGNACPGGYTECDGDMCDLHPACRQNEVCGDAHTYPPDLPCVVPKRAITQGEGRGEVIVVHSSMTFDDAEQDCVARGGHLASVHSSEDFQEIHEAAERAFVMNAVFIGAYEPTEGVWAWTDGSAWDEREMSGISNGAYRDNSEGNNEDEMAYCNSACSRAHAGDDSWVGIHDWGTRNGEWTEANGNHWTTGTRLSYACRLDADQSCSAETLVDRSATMSAACQCGDGEECAQGIPKNCPSQCGDAVVEFERACRSIIHTIPGMSATMDRALESCRSRERSGGTDYVGVAQRMSWSEARNFCQENYPGGDLASIHNEDENAEALRACTAVAGSGDGDNGVWNHWEPGIGHYCWIGLTDADREGSFTWSDGSATDFLNWNDVPYSTGGQQCGPCNCNAEPSNCGDPNVNGGDEDYVQLLDSVNFADGGTWNDAEENAAWSQSLHFVCQTGAHSNGDSGGRH